MRKLGEQLGTSNDTNELRERLREGRAVTNSLCKEAANLLRKPSNQKPKQEKLKRSLQQCVDDFEKMAGDQRRVEKENLVQLEQRYSAKYGGPPDLSAYESGSYQPRKQTQLNVQLGEEQLDEVDIAIINDRNKDMQVLEKDMEELAEVFQDVNAMVAEQGVQIDTAADNVQSSGKKEMF